MSWNITAAVRLVKAGQRILERKWSFLGIFVVVFTSSVLSLGQVGLLPDTPKVTPATTATAAAASAAAVATSTPVIAAVEEPVKIEIPVINLSATISNPTTTNIEVLDQKLLSGAARYPTSAKLGENGNMVLFGHSSYLPVVGNPAYKTFNGIQKLVAGDEITVYSADAVYTYRVRSEMKESATTAGIDLSVTGRVLTLATCNSFGEKTDRFVVVADFVGSHAISI